MTLALKDVSHMHEDMEEDHFQITDDGDIQKRELKRLLSTAKTKSRKDLLEKALFSLDLDKRSPTSSSSSSTMLSSSASAKSFARSPMSLLKTPPTTSRRYFPQDTSNILSSMPSSTVHTSSQSRLSLGHKSPTDLLKSQVKPNEGFRPMSAQRSRRGSFIPTNLDIIPENKWLNQTNADLENEVDLSMDDISDISSSSFDYRRLPRYSIHMSQTKPSSTTNSSNIRHLRTKSGGLWISTGFGPHFIAIYLKEKWLFRKLQVSCVGVESISVMLDGFKDPKVMSHEFDNVFVFDLKSTTNEENNGVGIARKTFTLIFTKTTQLFFGVNDMKITALPYV